MMPEVWKAEACHMEVEAWDSKDSDTRVFSGTAMTLITRRAGVGRD